MRANQINVGETYGLTIGTKVSPVKVVNTCDGGWECKTLKTGATIVVKSADRFVAKSQEGAAAGTSMTPAKEGTPRQAKTPNRKSERETAGGKMSALDAAAKVLGESNVPMNTKAMIEAMSAKGYWTSPGGKTPWATLYSAILRELTTNPDKSRFAKTERGRFALAKNG